MDFRVLSYNIHRAIGVDRLFRPERIANIIRYYEPDIVLLQEVDDGVPRSSTTSSAPTCRCARAPTATPP
jgi:endonuclease/exonuclease/phosphatase family metal-dependent hydrolase